jgi:hypothetical protein
MSGTRQHSDTALRAAAGTDVAGVATPAGFGIDSTGSGYTTQTSAVGPSGATGDTFSVTPATGTQLVLKVQLTDTPMINPITPTVQITP